MSEKHQIVPLSDEKMKSVEMKSVDFETEYCEDDSFDYDKQKSPEMERKNTIAHIQDMRSSNSNDKSLKLFSTNSRIRKLAFACIECKYFEPIILLVITVNCIFLAMDAPDSTPEMKKIFDKADLVFNILYTIEMVIKVLASGFLCGKHAYLKSGWNILDFVVVLFGWLTMLLPLDKLSSVRSIRLLKPLKTISSVPGMRTQVRALLQSLPGLANVMMLLMFFVLIFGILGMQLFHGLLRKQCMANDFVHHCNQNDQWQDGWKCASISDKYSTNTSASCMTWCSTKTNATCCSFKSVDNLCEYSRKPKIEVNPSTSPTIEYAACTTVAKEDDWSSYGSKYGRCGFLVTCPTNFTCGDSGMNLYSNVNTFDNFPLAFITIYQSISLEGWVDVMYALHEAQHGLLIYIYFVFLILFGAFFIINLAISVIFIKFEQLKSEQQEESRNNSNESELLTSHDEELTLHDKKLMDDSPLGNPIEPVEMQKDFEPDESSDPEPNTDSIQPKLSWFQIIKQKAERAPKQNVFTKLVTHPSFDHVIVVCICINALILSLEHHDMGQFLQDFLDYSNVVFTIIFTIEMGCKLAGLGIWGYSADPFNIFDGVIVISSLVELVFFLGWPAGSGPSGFAALRTFRLLRVFKLLRFMKGLQEILKAVMSTVVDLQYFSLIMILFVFICALLGMQLYGTKLGNPPPRANFDTFFGSVVAVFQMLSGENWNEVMFDAVANSGYVSIFFTTLVFSFGNYLVLSLFFAILLGNFEDDEDEESPTPKSSKRKPRVFRKKLHILRKYCCLCIEMKDRDSTHHEDNGDDIPERQETFNFEHDKHLGIESASNELVQVSTNEKTKSSNAIVDFYADDDEDAHDSETGFDVLRHNSLLWLNKDNYLRRFCYAIVKHPWFDRIILLLIAMSSILLACDKPGLDTTGPLKQFLEVSNLVFTIIFAAEMGFKITALGFIHHEGAYWRSKWNALDGTLVIFSLLNLAYSKSDLSSLRALRGLRALRPLRMVSRFESTKVVINSIIQTIPALLNVLLIAFLFFYIFGVIAVQNYKGRMYVCYEVTEQYERIFQDLSKVDCLAKGYYWKNQDYGSFDNIGSAILLLFEVASLEMWPGVMHATMDGRIDLNPIRDNEQTVAIFFIIFLLICGFFVMSLFIGVVVDEYQKYHSSFSGAGITEDQKVFLEGLKEFLLHKPKPPLTAPIAKFRKRVFRVVQHSYFELFITLCIVLNILVMTLVTDPQTDEWKLGIRIANYIFTVIFGVEMLLKLIGLGAAQYWRDSWNDFDGAIVIMSIIFLIFEFTAGTVPFNPTIARVFRMLRIFRIIKKFKSIKQLIYTLIFSVPALFNVSLLMFIIFFIYACMGMALFGHVQKGDFLDQHANFENFENSMMTLFRMATGESWNGIMHDCMITEPFCPKAKCGSPGLAIFFFVSFTLVSSLVMINIFVAVILENFEEQVARDKKPMPITGEDYSVFVNIWTQFSQCNPSEMDCLAIKKLPAVLNLVPAPLGKAGNVLRPMEMNQFIASLDLPSTMDGKVHIVDVGMALTMRVCILGGCLPSNKLSTMIKKNIERSFPKLKSMRKHQKHKFVTADQVMAASVIQKVCRRWLKKRRLQKEEEKKNIITEKEHKIGWNQ